MKKRMLIACTMQMDVIKYVMKKHDIRLPILWMNRSLHRNSQKLHACIQEGINRNQDVDEILLSYGLCGNAVVGLCSDHTKLIYPAFDDCICQILYTGNEKSKHIEEEKGCYYLTREWTIDKESIVSQCNMIYERYGEEYGKKMIHEIYSGYHSIVVVQTGAYVVEEIMNFVDKAAEYTGMRVKMQEGSCKVIENLLLGNYDKTIIQLNPGEMAGSTDSNPGCEK